MRCVIAIAHQLTATRNADRIAVMDGGRIIELGSHAELMVGNGLLRQPGCGRRVGVKGDKCAKWLATDCNRGAAFSHGSARMALHENRIGWDAHEQG